MQLNEYQREVMRTANRGTYPEYVPSEVVARHTFDAMVWALGLTGEAGEVADLLKKGIGHSHGVEVEKLKKELGDVLWYLGALADAYGLTLEEVAQANVAKLRARYPQGFTVEASKAKADELRPLPIVRVDQCVDPDLCTKSAPCTFHSCRIDTCYCDVRPKFENGGGI